MRPGHLCEPCENGVTKHCRLKNLSEKLFLNAECDIPVPGIPVPGNSSIFLMVSEPVSKKFGTEKSPGTGLEKIWYRKKSRNRSRKKLVPKKVPEPVSKKFSTEKSLTTGIKEYICTLDCNDHLVSLIMLPIIACQGYNRKVSQEMQ